MTRTFIWADVAAVTAEFAAAELKFSGLDLARPGGFQRKADLAPHAVAVRYAA